MIPKGKIFIIGGHEDKGLPGSVPDILDREKKLAHFEILRKLISDIPKAHHVIEIIAAASEIPEEMETLYKNAYQNAGFTKIGIIRVDTPEQAHDIANVQRIAHAHSVFFTGGDQKKLTSLISNSPLLDAIKRKYYADKNFIIAGTSAGAMSIPAIMISRGIIEEALLKSDIELHEGLGIIDGIIVDTHFVKRGRFGRLAYAVASCEQHRTGIGLGEDTALIISNGNEAECIGSGMVIIIDGSAIRASNIHDADEETPIAIENLKVNILSHGCKYLIKEKQMMLRDSNNHL